MKWYNDGDVLLLIFLICSIGGCVSCHKIDADYKLEELKIEQNDTK